MLGSPLLAGGWLGGCRGALTLTSRAAGGTRCSAEERARGRVIVLGIDGLDYEIVRQLLAAGRLPHLAGLAGRGTFQPLQTSMPPLSPVAWTNFITGMNPGGHGVFDFFRRDPAAVKEGFLPEDAVTDVAVASWLHEPVAIPGTSYIVPPSRQATLVRHGPALWQLIEAAGYQTTIYKMPANFPVAPSAGRTLSGMGTPDIEGSYGTFTYLSDDPADWNKSVSGGRIMGVVVRDGDVRAFDASGQESSPWLTGPANPFRPVTAEPGGTAAMVPFEVRVDPAEHSALIAVQGEEVVLRQGEWSGWLPVRFTLLPAVKSLDGRVRFFLKEAAPHLRLFVAPINLAPGSPGLATADFDRRLEAALGSYYTKGMPEETKALAAGVLSAEEYVVQSKLVLDESLDAIDFIMSEEPCGLVFFYISTVDLNSHMLWKYRDADHPAHDPAAPAELAGDVLDLYARMDEVVGRLELLLQPQDVLYVLSDHGFLPFRREVNLMRWLEQEGYLVYRSAANPAARAYYDGIDWARTRAYGVGFQGLYLNLAGREASGIVAPQEAGALAEEIRAKLLALRDGAEPVLRAVYRAAEIYSGSQVSAAPDLVLGYEHVYGPSDDSVLGSWAAEVLADHLTGFSGHHFVDAALTPGVLFSSRRLDAAGARLEDVTATLLHEFDVPLPAEMTGRPLA